LKNKEEKYEVKTPKREVFPARVGPIKDKVT